MTAFASTLQLFFTDRLMRQRQVSQHTIAAYRDAFRMLLVFASKSRSIPPSRLDFGDLDAPLIGAFLAHLKKDRRNGARTRNARLVAVRSLFRFAAFRHRNMPPPLSGCLRYRRSASIAGSSPSSMSPKLQSFYLRRTAAAGLAGAIRSCSPSPRNPACASPNLSACGSEMFTSARGPTSAVWAKAARCGSRRSRPRWSHS